MVGNTCETEDAECDNKGNGCPADSRSECRRNETQEDERGDDEAVEERTNDHADSLGEPLAATVKARERIKSGQAIAMKFYS